MRVSPDLSLSAGALGVRFGAKGNLTNIDVFRLLEDICHCTSDCFGRHSELLSCLLQLLFELRAFHVFAECGVSKTRQTRTYPKVTCQFLPQSVGNCEHSCLGGGVYNLVRDSLSSSGRSGMDEMPRTLLTEHGQGGSYTV